MTCLVMGIVNVTPDSFSDGGLFLAADAALAHGLALRAHGAAILDVGGESTRPGADRVDPELEQERVLPVVTALAAVAAGARIVNDVSGGLSDPEMLSAVAGTGADIVLQHWRGYSSDMYAGAVYDDIVTEVVVELSSRVEAAAAAGIAPSRVVVDPGIGFGKKGAQNWAVLHGLSRIVGMGPRVLLGTSRKRFLAETLEPDGDEASVDRRDLATAVTSVLAARTGVWGVRVHDVAATVDALKVADAWESGARWTS
jgi:dihydropteroate synthase